LRVFFGIGAPWQQPLKSEEIQELVVSAAAISMAAMSAIGKLSTLPTGTGIVTDATTRLRRIGYPVPQRTNN
jgi:hypothetical protein